MISVCGVKTSELPELLLLLRRERFCSDASEESEDTGFVAEVSEEARRASTRGRRVVDAAVAETFESDPLRGGATGIHEESELIGFCIQEAVLWSLVATLAVVAALVADLRRTDSPRLAFAVGLVSNWTSVWSKATHSLPLS